MSDYPTQRPGYTRTGKSIKAVKRYYAMKNKKRRTTDDRDDESHRKERERVNSMSKRKRSPDDDKLSKRIAAELRVQQEALEKRKDREPYQLIAPTERSGLPIVLQPRDFGGPTFVSEPERLPPSQPNKSVSAKSVKSTKSVKSNRSAGEVARAILEAQMFAEQSKKLSIHSLGCVVICLVMASIFITTWLLMLYVNYGSATSSGAKKKAVYSLLNVKWMAYASLPVIFAVPYFLIFRENYKHVLLALVLMGGSTFGVTAFFIYILAFYQPLPLKMPNSLEEVLETQNPLIFWSSVNYLLVHLLAICLLIRQVMYTVSKQVDEKSVGKVTSDAHMSMYLSPS